MRVVVTAGWLVTIDLLGFARKADSPLALSPFAIKMRHMCRRITTPKDRVGGQNGFEGSNLFVR
jgi:hypothetical protein